MEEYRTRHATPGQIDTLWGVIGTLQKKVDELAGRLNRIEAGEAGEAVTAGSGADVTGSASS